MFYHFRKNLQKHSIFLWLVIIGFTFGFGTYISTCGGPSPQTAIKINDTTIPYTQFERTYQNISERWRDYYKTGFDDEKQREIYQYTLDEIIKDYFIKKKAKERKVIVTDADIIQSAMRLPQFRKEDGSFDKTKFNRAVKSRDSRQKRIWLQYESQARYSLIRQKALDLIIPPVVVTEDEILERYREKAEEIQLQHILITPGSFIAEDDIKDYYYKNIETFKEPEKVKVAIIQIREAPDATEEDHQQSLEKSYRIILEIQEGNISFDSAVYKYSDHEASLENGGVLDFFFKRDQNLLNVPPSPEEDTRVRLIAEDIYNQLLQGGDFEKLVEEFSEDPGTKRDAGEYGWTERGELLKDLEKVVFSKKPGEYAVVRTDLGYFIIRVNQSISDRVNFSQIVLKWHMKYDFEEAAFTTDIGKVANQPVVVPGAGIFIIKTIDKKKEHQKTLEEAEKEIRRMLAGYDEKTLAREKGDFILDELDNGRDFNELVKQYSNGFTADSGGMLPYINKSRLVNKKNYPDLSDSELTILREDISAPYKTELKTFYPVDNQITDTVFQLMKQEHTGTIETPVGIHIFRLIKRKPIDMRNYPLDREDLKKSIQSEKRAIALETWLEWKKKNADVYINPILKERMEKKPGESEKIPTEAESPPAKKDRG